MFSIRRKKPEDQESGLTVGFVKAVKGMADRVKAEEPYRIVQWQYEIRETRHQKFLEEVVASGFTREQAEVLWKHLGR